jgi:hypothetical protein
MKSLVYVFFILLPLSSISQTTQKYFLKNDSIYTFIYSFSLMVNDTDKTLKYVQQKSDTIFVALTRQYKCTSEKLDTLKMGHQLVNKPTTLKYDYYIYDRRIKNWFTRDSPLVVSQIVRIDTFIKEENKIYFIYYKDKREIYIDMDMPVATDNQLHWEDNNKSQTLFLTIKNTTENGLEYEFYRDIYLAADANDDYTYLKDFWIIRYRGAWDDGDLEYVNDEKFK